MSSGTPSEISLNDSDSFTDIMDGVVSPQFAEAPSDNSLAGYTAFQTISNIDPVRHEKYYFDDGSVMFTVGEVAYKLHRYLFSRESSYFANLFALPETAGPIALEDKSNSEFDAFLSVLYATCYREPDISSFEDWSSVLRLASEWSFDDIRSLSLQRLDSLATPVDKIALSHAHKLSHWIHDAYVSLCTRRNTLSATEIKALQAEDVALIIKVRELYLPELGEKKSEIEHRISLLMASAIEVTPHSTENASAPVNGVSVAGFQEASLESVQPTGCEAASSSPSNITGKEVADETSDIQPTAALDTDLLPMSSPSCATANPVSSQNTFTEHSISPVASLNERSVPSEESCSFIHGSQKDHNCRHSEPAVPTPPEQLETPTRNETDDVLSPPSLSSTTSQTMMTETTDTLAFEPPNVVHTSHYGPETTTGDENEDVLLTMRAKLFHFNHELMRWEDRALGNICLFQHKETTKVRLLMRDDKTSRVCINHKLTPDMKLQRNVGSDRSWVWTVPADCTQTTAASETFSIRFADVEASVQFKNAFEEAQEAKAQIIPTLAELRVPEDQLIGEGLDTGDCSVDLCDRWHRAEPDLVETSSEPSLSASAVLYGEEKPEPKLTIKKKGKQKKKQM